MIEAALALVAGTASAYLGWIIAGKIMERMKDGSSDV